jgi:hypothetical protein
MPASKEVAEATAQDAAAAAAAAAAAQAYGAAAVSLIDPACKPGTPQFASAKARMDQLLHKYRDRVAQLAAAGVSACSCRPGYRAGMDAQGSRTAGQSITASNDTPAMALAGSWVTASSAVHMACAG